MHTEDDFNRIRINLKLDEDPTGNSGESPWKEGFALLRDNKLAQETTTMNCTAVETIIRGEGAENYMNAARSAARAYQLALRWKIEGKEVYAEKQ